MKYVVFEIVNIDNENVDKKVVCECKDKAQAEYVIKGKVMSLMDAGESFDVRGKTSVNFYPNVWTKCVTWTIVEVETEEDYVNDGAYGALG